MEDEEEGTEVYLSEKQVLRSVFFFFEGTGPFQFDAGPIKPYSFELVNTSGFPIFEGKTGKQVLVSAVVANNAKSALNFPGVVYYRRNDVVDFNFGVAVGTCFIRAEIFIDS